MIPYRNYEFEPLLGVNGAKLAEFNPFQYEQRIFLVRTHEFMKNMGHEIKQPPIPPYDPYVDDGHRLFLLRPPEIFRKISIEVFGIDIVPQFTPNKRKR